MLRQQGQIPASYHRAVSIQYTFDPLVNEYLRRTIGIDAANRLYREEAPAAFWTARYFRDLQKEEYFIVLLPDGALHSVHHTIAEAAPGANLTEEQAQARAEEFLREAKKIDLSRWKLVEAQSNKLPARTDHNFIWEEAQPLNPAPPGAETAHVRISLVVQGDELSGYRIFVHLPEDWVRRQNATTLANTLQTVLFVSLVGGLGLAMLIIFLRSLKTSLPAAVPWRGIALWALVVLAASLVRFATLVPQYMLTYRTDQPFATFIGTLLIGQTLAASLFYSGTIFLLGLAVFFLAQGYGFDRVPLARILPSVYYRDAILIMLCGWAVLAGFRRLRDLVAALWPVAHYGFPASVPEGLDAIWPALSSLATAIIFCILAAAVIALVLGFATGYLRRASIQWLVLAALAIFSVPRWGSAGDFVQTALLTFLELAVIWWGVSRLARLNLLGYLLLAMLLSLTPAIDGLLTQPNAYFRSNGVILIAAAAILIVLPLILWRSAARRESLSSKFAPV